MKRHTPSPAAVALTSIAIPLRRRTKFKKYNHNSQLSVAGQAILGEPFSVASEVLLGEGSSRT
jgi:hypothetical protein